MKTVKVMNIVVGDGIPKLVVPMVGKASQELIEETKIVANYGADICKIAVMPNTTTDVLTLLDATNEMQIFLLIAQL